MSRQGAGNANDNVNKPVPVGLAGLGGRILATEAKDVEAVVQLLTQVENAIEEFNNSVVGTLLSTAANGLRSVVLNEVRDAEQTMRAIAQTAEAVESYLATAEADRDDKALRDVAACLSAALDPSTESTVAAASNELPSLDSIAARLLACDATDAGVLNALADPLEAWASSDQVAEAAREPLRIAAAYIIQAAAGNTDEPQAALERASETLGEALVHMEAEGFATGATLNEEAVEASEPVDQAKPVEPTGVAPTTPETKPAQGLNCPPAVLPESADMEILKDYIVESLDHIEAAEGALLALESDPDETEQINTVFRAFHTIKGTSGFFELERNQELAHLAENLLDRARNGEIRITGGYADLCLKSCDLLRQLIEGLQGKEPGDELPVPEGFAELIAQLEDPAKAGITETESVQAMRVGDILVGTGAAKREEVEAAADLQGDEPIGQTIARQHVAPAQEVAKAIRTQKAVATSEAFVRVGTGRLDNLINMIGELVIAQSMVSQDPAVTDGARPRLTRNVSHAGKIIRDLQDLTMSLRMVPLKGVFQKMVRLTRDLGRKSGKDVQMITDGEETEIDRSMVDMLNDPLLHMIRNSVDHGVEPAEDREKAGKLARGTVQLRAYHSAGNVVIEVQDDGKGLDRDRIRNKAIERGLIEADKELSESQIFDLIFQPGFSTAAKVTDISGRGVGMDVVRRGIEEMRGRVEVSSEPGKGTKFVIRLPLTMAITDAMFIRVGNERYLLPTISIEQSFRPEPGTVTSVVGRGEQVMLRGDLLPVFRLHKLFKVREAVMSIHEGILIVIEAEGKRCAVMVDELLGQQQVVIKSLGQTFGQIPGVSGAAILGDGAVGLILDAGGILQLVHEADTLSAAPALAGAGA